MASEETALVNSIVGAGTYFKGNISVSGLLRIDGDFSGGVKSSGRVIIGRGGRADCTVDAATVVIGGVFRGTVYASDKVIALDTAIIIGNIYSPRIIAESGVILDGAMHVRGVEARTIPHADDTILSDTGKVTTGSRRRNRRRPSAAADRQRTL
ncbi:MAG: polymer-forming cytoskeletal protein [Alkalispirochaeta sp.]